MSKRFKFKGEVTEKIVQALEKEGADESALYVGQDGELLILVDNEGNYHPDDRSALKEYYQPTGITV